MERPTHRTIGKTSLRVHAIGLGAMPLSIQGRPDEKQALAVINASIDAGVNLIDTANVYCIDDKDIGHNERLIQKALESRRATDKITVATKGGCTRPNGDWDVDGRPESLRRACEQSLKALNRDCITLYQLHAPDHRTSFADSVGMLAKLQTEGKIQHIGLSNVSVPQLNEAQAICRIESVQNRCHPFFKRDLKNGMLEACVAQQVTYICYSPVGGTYNHQRVADYPLLQQLAKQHNCTPYGVILGWLLAKGPQLLPIPGASKVASATDSPKATQVKLTADECASIDRLPDAY